MTLNLLLDCSNNEDKVNNLSENFIFNVVTETPVNEHFFAFKENGLNFFLVPMIQSHST